MSEHASGIHWDYEGDDDNPAPWNYYHIFVTSGPMDTDEYSFAITFPLPRTVENDALVIRIVDALQALECKVKRAQDR